MKKIILIIGILFMCLSMQAQFYLKGYSGYSLSAGNKQIYYYQILNGRMDGISADMKFGQGLNLGLSAGYTFNKNIALEITGNTQLFSGLNFSAERDLDLPDLALNEHGSFSFSIVGFGYKREAKTTNHVIQLAPQLVFSSNPYGKWIFYLKGGPDFLYAKSTITENSHSYKLPFEVPFPLESTTPSKYAKQEYSGGINIGAQFSTGAEYSLKENIRLFAEITDVNVRYNFKKYKYLQYEIDGLDAMSNLDTIFGERDNKVNFNHFGLNIGIKYIFGK